MHFVLHVSGFLGKWGACAICMGRKVPWGNFTAVKQLRMELWEKNIYGAENAIFGVWKNTINAFVIKKNKLLWEADKNSSKRTKKEKNSKTFFEKDSKNSNLDFTRNVVKREVFRINFLVYLDKNWILRKSRKFCSNLKKVEFKESCLRQKFNFFQIWTKFSRFTQHSLFVQTSQDKPGKYGHWVPNDREKNDA